MLKKIVNCHLAFDCLHSSPDSRNVWVTIRVKEGGEKTDIGAIGSPTGMP